MFGAKGESIQGMVTVSIGVVGERVTCVRARGEEFRGFCLGVFYILTT